MWTALPVAAMSSIANFIARYVPQIAAAINSIKSTSTNNFRCWPVATDIATQANVGVQGPYNEHCPAATGSFN